MVDDQVKRAMQKWPQVPDVYGWLRLDRRGRWLLIDPSQTDSDDAGVAAGSAITSPPIVDFIGRNYECDARGAWYWQNGPQRAFASLELAPLILRVLNARNDPFLPEQFLAKPSEVAEAVELDYPAGGGHVGFTRRNGAASFGWLPDRLIGFFMKFTDYEGAADTMRVHKDGR